MPNPFANHVSGRNVVSFIRLLASGGGRIPTPPDGLTVPEALYRMLAKRKEPVRDDFWTEKAWRAAHEAWRKRWDMPREGEEDGVQAAHCNQYGHKPGCNRGAGAAPAEKAGDVHSVDFRMPGSLPKDWRPLSVTSRITPQTALHELKKGVSVTDPTGHKVRLDEMLLEHWKEAGKTEEDIQERLASLPIARKALAHPNEIWLDEKSGVRTYLAAALGYNGKTYVIAFTLGGENNGILQTYRPESRNINSKRQGKLIYSQQKKGGAR